MDIRTENLTILFVDIAGFTAVTSQQSRKQNAQLLESFNKVLLPLIRRYKGRVVKSIGDALLVTLRSPTDAMLCSMALQDAIHEANLRINDVDRIHIRVAASLGEVRVTKNDIFGEPVNVASRIEAITPADEIYLSEAVYLAMNKAEVPAKEVGFRELPGIAGNLRIYSIPRFSIPRLVPQTPAVAESGSELLYPYGGMHFNPPTENRTTFAERIFSPQRKNLLLPFVVSVSVVAIAGVGLIYGFIKSERPRLVEVQAVATAEPIHSSPSATPTSPPAQTIVTVVPPVIVTETPAPFGPTAVLPTSIGKVALATETQNVTVTTPQILITPSFAVTPILPTAKPAVTPKPVKPTPRPTLTPAFRWNVLSAKAAYRSGKLTKQQYNVIIERLEEIYEAKIRALKIAYKAGAMSRDVFEIRVRAAKQAYRGE